jgi:tRNA threonylcarbamoyladenosine biosynthesis protein TsaB
VRMLALDAATETCSVALLADGELIVRSVESGKSSALQILALVREVAAEARVSLTSLDGIAASIGPGAFTGVRITVAVAQGLAFGLNLPVVPVMTLEALALRVLDGAQAAVLACLDARMGEVYWGCFETDAARGVRQSSPPAVGPPSTVTVAFRAGMRLRGIGRGFAAYPELAQIPGIEVGRGDAEALPNAREFVRLGALRLAAGEGVDAADLQPLYLRDKVALTEAERSAHTAPPPQP